jgi:LysR family transcriptional activator of glutamate synthase operon
LLSDRVQLLLNGLRDSLASARELASGQRAPLRIGYTDEFSRSVLPGLVRHLKEHEASADIRLTTGMAQELPARVSDGLIDLALLCPMPEEQPHAAWHVQLLPPAELVVGLRHEHPLALGAAVSLAQIADEPFVASAIPGAGTEILVERLLAQQGLRRKVVQTVDDPHLLNSLVASGVGILVATAEDFAPYATLRAVPLSPRVAITRGAISRSFNQSELLQRARTYIASEALRSDDALF